MDKKIIYLNSIAIAVLAFVANLSGIFWKGLYQKDTVSITAQMMGQDLVTLVIVVPLLLISLYLISRDSLRGRLIWMGTIFYFLYTYASMSFAASFNQLFLVYVALFSLSLYTFLGELISLEVKKVKESFSPGIISKITAAFLIIMGLMLAGMWLSIIVGFLLTGIDPAALENVYTTLVIQALDLAIVVPAAILTGYLLLKDHEWGYALAAIFLIKVSLLGTAILSMIWFMMGSGVEVAMGQVMFFVVVTIGGILIAMAFYNNIKGTVTG
jgi:hypothetical protein